MFQKVFLRGQPSALISLDAESFDRDEEAQVLAWSGDWVKIRKENPVVEGWLRAKYLGGWPYHHDFELMIQRWWLMAPSPSPQYKIHFKLSELRANYRMCSYDDVDARSQQAMRDKGRRLEALGITDDDTVEPDQQSYGYIYLEIPRGVAFFADNPDYTYKESWREWKRLSNASVGSGAWVEQTMHWVHFTLGYVLTDTKSLERLVKHINLKILDKEFGLDADHETCDDALFIPRLAHVFADADTWAAGRSLPAFAMDCDELLDLVEKDEVKGDTKISKWMEVRDRDLNRWQLQLNASTKAREEAAWLAQDYGRDLRDITCAETNTKGISDMPWLLQERLIAIADYLLYSGRPCANLHDYLQSHVLTETSLHISDWSPHYYEWWPNTRFHSF
jgi:hypothetical protein